MAVYWDVCLKLSSRCLHFCTRGMFQGEKKKIVIHIGSEMRKKEEWATDRIQAAIRSNIQYTRNSIQDIASRLIWLFFIFSWCDILRIYWTAPNKGPRKAFQIKKRLLLAPAGPLFIHNAHTHLLLQNCTRNITRFGTGEGRGCLNVRPFFVLDVCSWCQNNAQRWSMHFFKNTNQMEGLNCEKINCIVSVLMGYATAHIIIVNELKVHLF